MDSDSAIASQKLQTDLLAIQNCFKNWRMKANGSKSIHVTFTARREMCPTVHINSVQLPQEEDMKYLGLHLDRRLNWHKHIFTRRLNWHKHIFTKRKELGITLTKMYWLLGHNSKLSTSNKLFIYKTILKPAWTYRIQLCGMASTSNIEIVELSQLKALRMIADAPWFLPNTVIRKDLQTPTVKAEIRRYSSQYSAHLRAHPNDLIVNLIELPDNRRLRRHLSNDLPTRFLM
jgi:hypothetical protein